MKYYSQSGQDEFIDRLFRKKTNGFFLDIGAHDGVSFSNTYYLEKYRDWKGICIEPIPEVYTKLSENRNCIKINACVAENEGKETFIRVKGNSEMLSGLKSFYTKAHLARLKKEVSENNGEYYEIEIDCININKLLSKQEIFEIDYCNIDTEGSELAILGSINFERFNIKALSIENNYKNNRIPLILRSFGYKFLCKRGADDIFVKNNAFPFLRILIIWVCEKVKRIVKKTLNSLSMIKHKLIK